MNMNKRFLSLTLALVMVLGSLASLTPVLAAETAVELSDIDGHWAEAHIKKAVKEGLVKGYKDGTFKPGASLARAEMATILARAFELKDEASLKDFTDVKSTDWFYSAMAKAVEAGIFKGDGDKLMPTENIRRDHAFATLARALKLEKAEEFNKAFPDLDEMDQSVKGEVAALVNLGYVEGDESGKLNPAGEITRAEMTKIVNLALGFVVEEEPVELEVESVSAINAKSLKITFNKAVEDTTKAVFEVKKGSVKVNTSTITWNEAKTEVTVELTGKITAGEYTVNVTGLTEEVLTAKVTAEDEKVESVTILSETAPLTNVTLGSKTVTVGYKVENQYGEDITATTAITSTAGGTAYDSARSGSLLAQKGQVTIPVVDTAKEGDAIVLTLINTTSGKSVSQTVKVAAQSAVADIAITGLYNKADKTLTETTDVNRDAFYLLVEAKDQYGNVLKTNEITGLIGNNTNTLTAGINGGANPVVETIKVAGKDVTAIKVTGPVKAGETQVMLIAPASGKNATYTIKVAEAQRTDKVTFEVPELVVAGEELFVPITVTDKEGNVITELETIKDSVRGIQVSGISGISTAGNVELVKGQIGIKVAAGNAATNQEGYVSLVAVTSTAKSTIANIQVRKAAEATIVTGLKSGNPTTLLSAQKTRLSVNSLQVEDQYGRVMSETALTAWLAASADNKIIVKDTTATVVNLQEGTYNPANPTADLSSLQTAANSITFAAATKGVQVNGGTKGTEKVSITLIKDGTELATSTKEISFQVTDGTEYVSYEVNEIGKMFDETGVTGLVDDAKYTKKIDVYGVLSNGSKVLLTKNTDYSVVLPKALGTDPDALNVTTTADVPYAKDATEVKVPVTVTINATGKQFTQDVTISKVKPAVVDFKVVANTTASGITTKALFDKAEEVSSLDSALLAETDVNTLVDFVVVDSYGAVHSLATGDVSADLGNANKAFVDDVKLLATPAIANTITFTKQSNFGLTFEGLEKGESFTVTAKAGDVSKTFKVNGTLDTVAEVNTAKTALTTLAFDGTNNATHASPKIKATAAHGNGSTYAYTISEVKKATGGDDNFAAVLNSGDIDITRGDLGGTFKVIVTITKGSAVETKTFTVTVPDGSTGAVTIN